MIYGYARCSTDEEHQDIDRQKRELLTLGVKKDKYIYWEYEKGTKEDRAELQLLRFQKRKQAPSFHKQLAKTCPTTYTSCVRSKATRRKKP